MDYGEHRIRMSLFGSIFVEESFNCDFGVQTKFDLFCSVLEDIKNDVILKCSAQE